MDEGPLAEQPVVRALSPAVSVPELETGRRVLSQGAGQPTELVPGRFAGDDVDDPVDGIGAPDRRTRAADHLDVRDLVDGEIDRLNGFESVVWQVSS